MRRRDFGKGLAGGLLTTAIARAATALAATSQVQKTAATPRKNTMMHVGADYHVTEGGGVMSRRTSNTTCASASGISVQTRR